MRRAPSRFAPGGYRLTLADGAEIDKAEELAYLASPPPAALGDARGLFAQRDGDQAEAVADLRVIGDYTDGPIDRLDRLHFHCRRTAQGWQADRVTVDELADHAPPPAPPPGTRSLRRLLAPLARPLRRLAAAGGSASFQDLAYIPYKPGADYVLPPFPPPTAPEAPLPVPPQELWLGYEYSTHGEQHVRAMLGIVERSCLTLGPGDRILDVGCGSG